MPLAAGLEGCIANLGAHQCVFVMFWGYTVAGHHLPLGGLPSRADSQPTGVPSWRGDLGCSVLQGELKAKRRGACGFQKRVAPTLIATCSVAVSVTSVSCHVGLDTLLGLLSALASLGYGMDEGEPTAM